MVFVPRGDDGNGEGSLCLCLRYKGLTGLLTPLYITSIGGGVNAVSTV